MPAGDIHSNRHPARLLAACLLLGVAVAIALHSWESRRPQEPKNFGYVPDPAGAAAFLGEFRQPFFAQAAADCMAQAKGVDTFLYRPMYRAHQARYGKPFVVGRQLIGSCVAWGAMHAVFCQESVAWSLGESAEPPLMPSTEAIYGGARVQAMGRDFAGWSDGATGFGAAKFLKNWGVVYRQPFPEVGVDLTIYNATTEKNWGAYGLGGESHRKQFDAIAKKAPCQHVVAVRTWAELAAALEAGFPVTLASSQGFNSRLGPSGIMEASGSWMHQMVAIGIRYKATGSPDDCVLILNSWGPNWCGPYENRWPDDMPPGSFWARRRVVEGMLGDAWAIGSVKNGFKWRDIHNGNWMQPAPPEIRPAKPDNLFDVPAVPASLHLAP
jgi:hypothetical protein